MNMYEQILMRCLQLGKRITVYEMYNAENKDINLIISIELPTNKAEIPYLKNEVLSKFAVANIKLHNVGFTKNKLHFILNKQDFNRFVLYIQERRNRDNPKRVQ